MRIKRLKDIKENGNQNKDRRPSPCHNQGEISLNMFKMIVGEM